jgi:hypothetical protein
MAQVTSTHVPLICIKPAEGAVVSLRAGVVLRLRPVARAVATPGVGRVGTPTNRDGPVDRVGRR